MEYRDVTSEGLLRASAFKGLSKGTRRSQSRFASRSEWSTGMPDRDCNKTINDLLDVLDDEELIEAMEREDAQGASRTQ